MRTLRQLLAGFLILALTASSAAAQRHVVDPSTLASTVAAHARLQDAQRAEVREALSRPEVQSVATNLGLNPETLSDHVNTLDADTLSRAAQAAHDINQALTGGGIGITLWLLVLLLVAILIIVIAV